MDEKSLFNLLSQVIPGSQSDDLTPGREGTEEQTRVLVDSLQALAGQTGGPMEQAVSQFLNGEGELLETTRASLSKSSSSAVDELSQLLIKQFGLAPLIARAVAALLVKLVPSIGKTLGKAKKKRRTTKRKTSSSGTKKKKKTTTRPKTTTGKKKPATKKKASTQSKKKKTATSRKRKTSQRSGTIAESPHQGAA